MDEIERLRLAGFSEEEINAYLERKSRSDVSNFGRGVMAGLSKAGTSLVKGAGYLGEVLGAEDNALTRFARETEEEARKFYDPRGRAGEYGQMFGAGLGNVATAAAGAGALGRALGSVAPRAAAALRGTAPLSQRVAATTAVNAPVDVLQGLAEEEGMALPGRAGAVAENVMFSALGGALPGRGGSEARPTERPSAPIPTPARVREATQETTRRLEPQVRRIERTTPITEPVVAEDYLNISRLTDDVDVQRRLAETVPEMVERTDVALRAPARPGERLGRLEEPETFEQLRARVASNLGVDVADMMDRTAKGARLGRDDMLRVQSALEQVVKEEDEVLQKIGLGAFADEADRTAAGLLAQRLKNEREGLFNLISKQRTETARDLSALRLSALGNADPASWIARIESMAKRSLSDIERAEVLAAARSKDMQRLMRVARDTQKSTTQEKIGAFFRTNILTNPKTHAINITGNVGMRALETLKDVPAALFDNLLSRATGIETKSLALRDLSTAGFRGAQRAVREAGEVLRRGDLDVNALDIPRQVNFETPLLNAYHNGVMRLLSAEDKFFHSMALTRSLEEQARVLAKAEGLRGSQAAARVTELVQKPSAAMEAQAMLDANVATFKDTSWLAEFGTEIRNKIAKKSPALAQVLLPFVRTPANIATRIVDYSPIGGAVELKNLAKLMTTGVPNAAAQRRIVESLGRSATGTAAIALGYMMAQDDRMTGFYPADERTRNAWEATGRTEGSALLGDQWVQVNRLSPLGNLMTIGAALHQLEQEDPNVVSMVAGSLTAPFSSVYDLPMVSGLRDVVDSFRPGESKQAGFAQYAGRVAQGFVPAAGLVRGVATGMDEYRRQTRTGEGKSVERVIQSGIPGAAQELPVKLSAFGEPVKRPGGMLQALFLPVNMSPDRTAAEPLLDELSRVQAIPSPLTQREGEPDQQFAVRQREIGRVLRDVLSGVVKDPQYQQIQQEDARALREALAGAGIDTAQMSDEQVRSRYQRFILDRVITGVKTEGARYFPSPRPEVVTP